VAFHSSRLKGEEKRKACAHPKAKVYLSGRGGNKGAVRPEPEPGALDLGEEPRVNAGEKPDRHLRTPGEERGKRKKKWTHARKWGVPFQGRTKTPEKKKVRVPTKCQGRGVNIKREKSHVGKDNGKLPPN